MLNTAALQSALLQRESSGDYNAVNSLGYTGGYQFGAQALETLGYLKRGSSKAGNSALDDPENWTGKSQVSSKAEFLANPEAQDEAFRENLVFNRRVLENNGTISEATADSDVAGFLAAAHLLGANGASLDLASTDNNGVSGQDYFNLGKNTSAADNTQNTIIEPTQGTAEPISEPKRDTESYADLVKGFYAQQTTPQSAELPSTDLVSQFNTRVPVDTSKYAAAGFALAPRDYAIDADTEITETDTLVPSGLVSTFKRAMKSGAENLDADLSYFGAAIDALQGDEAGLKASVENARIQEEFAAIPMRGIQQFSEFVDEPTVGGFFEQVASGTGQIIPSVLSTFAGAGVGSITMLLGKEALSQGGRQAAKELIKSSLEAVAKKNATPDEKNIAQAAYEAGKEAFARNKGKLVREGRGRDLKRGAIGGAFVSEYVPLTGGNVNEALESGRELDRGQAIRAGLVALPQATVGVLGEVGIVSLLAKKAASKSAGPNSVYGRLADSLGRNFLKGGLIEGGTELIQEEIAIQNRSSMDDTFTDADANLRRLNAGFVGFFGGGTIAGGGATAIQGVKELGGLPSATVNAAAAVTERASQMADDIKGRMSGEQSSAEVSDAGPDQTTREASQDINAQFEAMADSSSGKEAVWVSGTEPTAEYGGGGRTPSKIFVNGVEAYSAFIKGRGTIIATDFDVVESVVKGQASDAVLSAALGYSSVKTADDTQVVRVLNKDGNIVSEETTTLDGLAAAQEAARALMPEGGRQETIPIDEAAASRARRSGPDIQLMEDEGGLFNTENADSDVVIQIRDSQGNVVSSQIVPPKIANEEDFNAAFAAAQDQAPEGGSVRQQTVKAAREEQERQTARDRRWRYTGEGSIDSRTPTNRGATNATPSAATTVDADVDESVDIPSEQTSDVSFESNTRTHTFTKQGKEQSSYTPEKGANEFKGVKEARAAYAAMLGEEVDWSNPVFGSISQTTLQTAVKLQNANPDEIVTIKTNADLTYRIDIESTPDTKKIVIQDRQGNREELSVSEFITRTLSKSADSKQEFRTATVTTPEGKTKKVNPVDLMNAGRRIEESLTGSFTAGGPVQSSRAGLISMLAELQDRKYELDIQGVPINEILNNLVDPRNELDKSISNIVVGFDGSGKKVTLGFLLKPYVPGAVKESKLTLVENEDGTTSLLPDDMAREEERQNAPVLSTDEMGQQLPDGIPLTGLNIEMGESPIKAGQLTPRGSVVSSGPSVKITKGPDYKSGVTFPLGEINETISSLIRRLSRAIKLQNPVAMIGIKAFENKTRAQIKSYLKRGKGKTDAQKLALAIRVLDGTSKVKGLDLSDNKAVGDFMMQLSKDGLLKSEVNQYITPESDSTRIGFDIVQRAGYEVVRPLTNSSQAAKKISQAAIYSFGASTRKGVHMRFDGGTVILIDDFKNKNEAALTMVAAHEMGHALFKEELDNLSNNKDLSDRLHAAFNTDRQKARDEGKEIKQWETVGFEEWYADQVAAWVKHDALTNKKSAKNAVDSYFKRLVQRFKKMWNEMKNHSAKIYRRTNTLKRPFQSYMKEVIAARKDNAEIITNPVYNDKNQIVAYAAALGSIRDESPDASAETVAREGAQETTKEPARGEVEPSNNSRDNGGAGNVVPIRKESLNPSYELKTITREVRRQVSIQSGSAARAEAWRRKFQKWGNEFLDDNPSAIKIIGLLLTADSTMRWASSNKLADMLYVRSNDVAGMGFVQQRQLARDKWRAELFEVLGKDWTTAEVQTALKEAQRGVPTAELQNEKAKAVREYLERFHKEYITPSNTDIAFRPDYFPVLLNLHEIMNDPEAFVQLILENDKNADPKKVKKTVDNLVKYQKIIEDGQEIKADADILNPAAAVEARIKLTANINPSILTDSLFQQDPEVALMSYLDNVTKRVEWNRATKDANGNDKIAPELDGLPPHKREAAEAVLNTYLGNVTHLSPFWRKANSYAQAVNLVTLLPFAAFASIPDFAGAIVQTREFGGLQMFLKEVVSQFQDREAAKRFANDIGVVMPEAAANAWMSQLDSDMLDPTVRQATDKFFKWTGLTYLTTLSREVASGMAKRFLIEHANNPTSRSDRYLKEMGVTYDQVRRWQDNEFSFEGPDGEAVQAALVRFVESSVLRPNAAERPVWASDPRFALIWQLKSFIYAFNKVILQGLEREFAKRLITGEGLAPALAPILLITMAAFMPMAAVGLELREYAKVGLSYALPGIDGSLKYLKTDSMDYGSYFTELFSRSGLDGPLGMLTMAQRSGDWGGSALASLAGPTAELLEKALTDGPLDAAFSRTNSPSEMTGTILGVGAVARTLL